MSSTQHDTGLDALRAHFGLEPRRLRRRAGLSMNQLAKALGCTPQWIHQLEKAGKPVPEQMAFDLDTYFKTDGWEEDDEPVPPPLRRHPPRRPTPRSATGLRELYRPGSESHRHPVPRSSDPCSGARSVARRSWSTRSTT
jgi:transcriptional regulator with XRE-family HTH domain